MYPPQFMQNGYFDDTIQAIFDISDQTYEFICTPSGQRYDI